MKNFIKSRVTAGSARVRLLKAKQTTLVGIRLFGTGLWHFCGEVPELAFFLLIAIPVGAGIALETLFPSLALPLNAAWKSMAHWWKAHPNASDSVAVVCGLAVLGFLAWRLGERTSMEVKVDIDLNEATSKLSCLSEAQEIDAAISAPEHEKKTAAKNPRRL